MKDELVYVVRKYDNTDRPYECVGTFYLTKEGADAAIEKDKKKTIKKEGADAASKYYYIKTTEKMSDLEFGKLNAHHKKEKSEHENIIKPEM